MLASNHNESVRMNRNTWLFWVSCHTLLLTSAEAARHQSQAFLPRGKRFPSSPVRRSDIIDLYPIVDLRGGTSIPKEQENDRQPFALDKNKDTVAATQGSNSTIEEKVPSAENTAIVDKEDQEKDLETIHKDASENGGVDDESEKESVDIPSLDTFINYDEGTDALKSMAPILETTTTHVLDTITAHENDMEEMNRISVEADERNEADINLVEDSSMSENAEDVDESQNEEDELSEISLMEMSRDDLTIDEAQEKSSIIRLEGKQLHDASDYEAAARAFRQAALLLEPFVDESAECAEDWCTCRLHEALCCLKDDDSETAVEACTRVLDRPSTSGAVRARALYRRAKAYTGLDENELALQDARGAAFLGDRRGVALYGQLMRELPSGSSTSLLSEGGGMSDFASSSALFESLLSKSSPGGPSTDQTEDTFPPFNPLSLLSGMGGGPSMAGNGMDTGGLAKSVLSSLSKRLEDERTQDTICKYLQKTSGPQIQHYAGMAGMELPESQATRIASFLKGITPKTIRRTVKNGKRLLYGVQLIRKTSKVISKYRNVLIWICLLAWAKSAFLRPIPVNKRLARVAAKQAAKAT